ncbi:MAG: hypothetical protein WC683_04600 [bacterium]
MAATKMIVNIPMSSEGQQRISGEVIPRRGVNLRELAAQGYVADLEEGQEIAVCPKCKREFISEDHVRAHTAREHSGTKPPTMPEEPEPVGVEPLAGPDHVSQGKFRTVGGKRAVSAPA